jgi:rare lipoprotein A
LKYNTIARLRAATLVVILAAATLNSAYAEPVSKDKGVSTMVASYYADKFNGRRTANCTTFSNNKSTAAHKHLRFGTRVQVCNPKNGKCEIVTITDRGPYVAGRQIDLAKIVAKKLGIVNKGVATVTTKTLYVPPKNVMGKCT